MSENTNIWAEALVKKLVAQGCPPNERIANAQITAWAVEAGIDGDHFTNALTQAGENGWLDNGSTKKGWTLLTQAGWDAGNA